MTDYYEDLPEELQRFFPLLRISVPEEIRQYIRDVWPVIKPKQRDEIIMKCRNEHDLLQRVLTLVIQTTIARLHSRPSSSRRLSI
jgi:hypothetical protein